MKKTLILCLFTLGSLTTQAQEKPIAFGVKGGLNNTWAQLKEDSNATLKSGVGFQLGGVVAIPLGKYIAFQPEVLLASQGYELQLEEYNYKNESKIRFTYLTVPLNFNATIFNKVILEAGPYLDFVLNAKADQYTTLNSEVVLDEKDANVTDSFKKAGFGYNLGAGYKINERISINLRYYNALTFVSKADVITSLRNRQVQIGVGYSF
jgi:opacity protein-like surface antigen